MSKIKEYAQRTNNVVSWYNHHMPTLYDKETGRAKDFERTLDFQQRLIKELIELNVFASEAVFEAAKRQDMPELVLPKGVKLHDGLRND